MLQVGERRLRAEQGAVEARGDVQAMIRPERIRVEARGSDGANRVPGMLEHVVFLGSFREMHVRIVGGSLIKAVHRTTARPLAYEQGTPSRSTFRRTPSASLRRRAGASTFHKPWLDRRDVNRR